MENKVDFFSVDGSLLAQNSDEPKIASTLILVLTTLQNVLWYIGGILMENLIEGIWFLMALLTNELCTRGLMSHIR